MKRKTLSILSTIALLSLASFSVVSGAELGGVNVRTDVNMGVETSGDTTGLRVDLQTEARTGATETTEKATSKDALSETPENASSSIDEGMNDQNGLTAEEHRSTVASFVKSLLRVADREDGIGDQVREVAKSQNDSATTTAEAIDKVKSKGGISTFFFGSDYKNLGALRSEISKTQNNIDQLKNALTKVTNATDKAELSIQIKALEDSQVKVSAFVDAHENTFSMFGWLVRMFSK